MRPLRSGRSRLFSALRRLSPRQRCPRPTSSWRLGTCASASATKPLLRIPPCWRSAGPASGTSPREASGTELRDLTVGVVGTGRIGSAVLDRLRGFGCRALAYDTRPTAAARHVPLGGLLGQSDIVTLHTPLTADTHHLLDRRRIGQMKHGAFIINTGRGPLLDTESLLSALESGRLGGAALDVLEGEDGIFYADCRNAPIGNTLLPRLQQLPNVIISPHTAYYTDHALSDAVENTIINCLTFEKTSQELKCQAAAED